ncbi:putative DNA metabolism protein [Filimonas zeae]|uniref:DNA metabolism protein n=1 Tax=Filimonas zeae TaxID=1737353 RepID=A0A917J4R4_9BACT|nr:TIGR03915 family putative DNA repair protein [Filimonas zeae]MDR6340822.1 putative DNA metabolism protein [Filimonas zeae]GGH78314.1 DNA metabolism protein [Filimonas zeae]
MTTLLFDGSFPGLLTAIFEVYEYKLNDVRLATADSNPVLFGEQREVVTDASKAKRVWQGIGNCISGEARHQLYQAYLSELDTMPQTLLAYFQYAFFKQTNVHEDFSHPAVLTVHQTVRKVYREKHRMEAFVRFSETTDGLFYAVVEPDFDVLPLIAEHFEKRYADQRWVIYDCRRKYGIFYDLSSVQVVEMNFSPDMLQGKDASAAWNEKEAGFQHLWQQYFNSVNIASRKNTALHIRHMPLRYWKYLPEKQPAGTGMAG